MTPTVAANRGCQIRKHVEVLELTRASHGQQAGDGEFTLGASITKHDFPPLHCRSEGSLSGIVGELYLRVYDGGEPVSHPVLYLPSQFASDLMFLVYLDLTFAFYKV